MNRFVAISLFLICGGTTPALLAQGEVPLEVELRGCPHLSSTRIKELLEMELKTLGSADEHGQVTVRIDCFTAALVIGVQLSASQPAARRIESPAHELSERSLSLATSELVADLWAERRKQTQNESLAASVEPRAPSAHPSPRLYLGLNAGAVRFSQPARWALSLNVAADFPVFQRFEWGIQAAFSAGSWTDELVSVREKTVSVLPRVRYRLGSERVAFLLGASLPVGVVHWTPETEAINVQTADYSAVWLALNAEASLRILLNNRFFVAGNISVGGVLVPVRGTQAGESLIELDGLLLGANCGAGTFF